MKRSRFTEEQIIGILKEQQASAKTADGCRKHGISDANFYEYKAKYGSMEVSDTRELKALENEKAKLKKLLDETMLDNAILKDVASKSGDAPSRRCGACLSGSGFEAGCGGSCLYAAWGEAGLEIQDSPKSWRQLGSLVSSGLPARPFLLFPLRRPV